MAWRTRTIFMDLAGTKLAMYHFRPCSRKLDAASSSPHARQQCHPPPGGTGASSGKSAEAPACRLPTPSFKLVAPLQPLK